MKKWICLLIDLLVIAAAGVLIFTFLPSGMGRIWRFLFLAVSIGAQLLPMFLVELVKDTPYKIALFSASLLYLVLQIVINKIVLSVVLLLFYGLCMAFLVWAGSRSSGQETEFLKEVLFQLQACREGSSESVRKAVDELIETATYSNSRSFMNTKAIEAEILNRISDVEKMTINGRRVAIPKECEQIALLLQRRDQICKLHKGVN